MRENGVLFQYFEWYMDTQNDLWIRLEKDAKHLKEIGVTGVWIPPCYKATSGYDTGYGSYDLYDLGEFDQKGGVKTKYGSKEELISSINTLHDEGIQVYADVVLNHKAYGDEKERFQVIRVDENNRLKDLSDPYDIEAWTKFNFPGRGDKYSSFKWSFEHFTATDYDDLNKENGVFLIKGENKKFSEKVDKEKGNFDYLMFHDVDVNHPLVSEELLRWSEWFVESTKVDGFRFDAIKHIDSDFIKNFTANIKSKINNFYCVGEYWSDDLYALRSYMEYGEYTMDLFDVPLHFNFYQASIQGKDYDLRTIFDGTVVSSNKEIAVTFVDNHDSQPYQSLQSFIEPWFKPIAYGLILLRCDGYPCVFYGDYYGIKGEHQFEGYRGIIDKLLYVRSNHSYGEQVDYFDHGNVIGWVRKGNEEHPFGCAAVISNGDEGFKEMEVGKKYAGEEFADYIGNRMDKITVDENGWAKFPVNAGSISVWIKNSIKPNEAFVEQN